MPSDNTRQFGLATPASLAAAPMREVGAHRQLPTRYTTPAIALHWVIAALIGLNLILGLSFAFLPKSGLHPFVSLHESFGITVLGLALMRLLWRLTHRPPPLPDYPVWQQKAAHRVHALLYALMFALPLTGWAYASAWKGAGASSMRLFWTLPWPRIGFFAHLAPATRQAWHTALGQLHYAVALLLTALFVLHVTAVLKHQFVDRIPELQRMWRAPRADR